MGSLFNTLFGQKQGAGQPSGAPAQNGQAPDWNALMGQLQANPAKMIHERGFNVPDEISGNPQATVMHLIKTGQVGGPVMQMIQPMLARMGHPFGR